MATIRRRKRKMPDGTFKIEGWQALVKLPNGKQISSTDKLKSVVQKWAREQEAQLARRDWNDPRAGKITLAEWRGEWLQRRLVAATTADKDESRWRVHIEPRWGSYPLESIGREELEAWVKAMTEEMCPRCYRTDVRTDGAGLVLPHRADGKLCPAGDTDDEDRRAHIGIGRWTIQGVVHHLSGMLGDAALKKRIRLNPAAGLEVPRVDPKPAFFWSRPDAGLLLDALPERWRLMVDLDLHVGLRWGELAGLRCEYVDTDLQLIYVVGVQTRKGWREYPKSRESRRSVPIPPHLLDAVWQAKADRAPSELLFTAPDGGPLDDRNFSRRVFGPALARAGVPAGTLHDMRHTAASWLVMDSVDIYRVQKLLGHESVRTTERYAHLSPEAHSEILAAWQTNPVQGARRVPVQVPVVPA